MISEQQFIKYTLVKLMQSGIILWASEIYYLFVFLETYDFDSTTFL